MSHRPKVRYLCDDPECCDDGCPRAFCREDGQPWPCEHRREKDSPTRVAAHVRWAERVSGLEPRMDGETVPGEDWRYWPGYEWARP